MRFAHPTILYLLVLLIPLTILLIFNFRKKRKLFRSFLSPESEKEMSRHETVEISLVRGILFLLSFSLLVAALARPQWGKQTEFIEGKGLYFIYLLDTSNSMASGDTPPSRLDVAKNAIGQSLDRLTTDRGCLIHFSGRASIQCPFTEDIHALRLIVQASNIRPDFEQGTDLGAPLETVLTMRTEHPGERKVALLLTDGEDHESRWQNVLPRLKKANIPVISIGIGTAEGGRIPVKEAEGKGAGWKLDSSGNPIHTRLNEAPLLHIAKDTGGRYFRLNRPQTFPDFLSYLAQFERKFLSQKTKVVPVERYRLPLAASIFLLMTEMCLGERKVRWKKR